MENLQLYIVYNKKLELFLSSDSSLETIWKAETFLKVESFRWEKYQFWNDGLL